jgi:outer membrane protein assembly factor BamB
MVKKSAHTSMMRMVWGIFCLLPALAPAGGLFAADAGGGATAKPQASAKDLVRQLGDDSYKAREKAQKALIAMGADALDEVAAGTKSTDPETRSRCEQILTDIQKNLLASRTEAMKKSIVWKSPTDAAPAGAAVIVKGLAMLVDANGILHALEVATGKEKWHSDAQLGRFTLAAPAVDGATAYWACGGVNGNLGRARFIVATDVASGDVLWQSEKANGEISPPAVADGVVYVCGGDLRNRVPGRVGGGAAGAVAGGGPVGGPAVGAPAVAKNAGGYFEALDAKSGKSLWKLPLDSLIVSRPMVGKSLAFVPGDDLKVHAIDLKNNKEAWASEALKTPALAMRLEGQKLLVQISAALVEMESDTGKQAWSVDLPESTTDRFINGMRIRMMVSVNGRMMRSGQGERTFCVNDGTAYVPCGQKLCAVDVKSGQKQWEYEAPQDNAQGNAPGRFNGGMIAGGGQVIIQGGGQMVINGRLISGGMGQEYQPVVAGGAIYYGAPDGLHAVDLRTRQETWVLQTAGAVCTRPVVADGVIYFGVAAPPQVPAGMAPGMPGVPGVAPGGAPGAGGQATGGAATTAPAQGEKLPALFAARLPSK